MRLVRFGQPGAERPGVVVTYSDETESMLAYDVSELVTDFDAKFWASGGIVALDEAMQASEPPLVDLSSERLAPPVTTPSKIVCIGLNYRDHCLESGNAIPDEPVIFLKAPNTVVGPREQVVIPPGSSKTDWEVELGVVIARTARYLPDPGAARRVIGGYVLSNDVSEREFQLERGGQWVKGKSCETFNPLGPWVATSDDIADPQALRLTLDLNGRRQQDGTTFDMVFGVEYLVWYVSQFMVLEPGDIMNTGTPAGIGMGRTPPRYLRPGDRMTLTGEGLGSQQLECAAAKETLCA